jgi:prepilin-type N-terminal cleavage/methylation domain-containing protein
MRRGFTLVELMVVLGILAVFMPVAWTVLARNEDDRAVAAFHLRAAAVSRTVSEQMAVDQRSGERVAGAPAWTIGACEVRYSVDGGVLLREGCAGAAVALAERVERFEATAGGWELTLALPLRPERIERVTLFFPEVP